MKNAHFPGNGVSRFGPNGLTEEFEDRNSLVYTKWTQTFSFFWAWRGFQRHNTE